MWECPNIHVSVSQLTESELDPTRLDQHSIK